MKEKAVVFGADVALCCHRNEAIKDDQIFLVK
jgi:hypothetical protein